MAKKPVVKLDRELVEKNLLLLMLQFKIPEWKSRIMIAISMLTNCDWVAGDDKPLLTIPVNSKGRVVEMTYEMGYCETNQALIKANSQRSFQKVYPDEHVVCGMGLDFISAKAVDGEHIPEVMYHSIQVYTTLHHFALFWKNKEPLKVVSSNFTNFAHVEEHGLSSSGSLASQATRNMATTHGALTRNKNIKSAEEKQLDDLFGDNAKHFAPVQAELLQRMPTKYDVDVALETIASALKAALKSAGQPKKP